MVSFARTLHRAGLRRADWRFLLPSATGVFEYMVLLGGPESLAERVHKAGIAREVSRSLPVKPLADAVAVLSNSKVAVADAASSLAPGGVLYYEVDRRMPARTALTPNLLNHRLRRSGLTPAGAYWAAPDFENCNRFIPLDSPEAFQWYLSTLFLAGTSLYRLLGLGMRLYTRLRNHNFDPLAPCYAVTAINGSDSNARPSVLGHPAVPAELQRPGLRSVVLTSGQDDGSRVVVLPFAPGARRPAAVFKISTLPQFNANAGREQSALAEIRANLYGAMRQTIPQPLGIFYYGGLAVGIESCAAGHPLYFSSGRWPASFTQQIDDLRLAVNWLSEFHQQAQICRLPWSDAAQEQWIEKPLAAYAKTFGLTAGKEHLFYRVRQRARELNGASLPVVWQHYDFGPWNLYRNAQEFTVIDWEFGGNLERDRFGPALYDLLFFVIHWNHVVGRLNSEAAELQGFYRLFVRPDSYDKYTGAVQQAIADYVTALDIDARFLPLILVYMCIEQALHRFSRKQALGKVQAGARSDNRFIQYMDILAQSADRFLAPQTGD